MCMSQTIWVALAVVVSMPIYLNQHTKGTKIIGWKGYLTKELNIVMSSPPFPVPSITVMMTRHPRGPDSRVDRRVLVGEIRILGRWRQKEFYDCGPPVQPRLGSQIGLALLRVMGWLRVPTNKLSLESFAAEEFLLFSTNEFNARDDGGGHTLEPPILVACGPIVASVKRQKPNVYWREALVLRRLTAGIEVKRRTGRVKRGWRTVRTVNNNLRHVTSLPTHGQSYASLSPIAMMATLCMSSEEAFARWTGEDVGDVVFDDGGRRKGGLIGVRITLSIRLQACAHIQSFEALLVWTRTGTKTWFHASACRDGLRGSQDHFAGGERDGRANHAIGVLTAVFYTAEISKTNISPSNSTGFAVLPTAPPRSNIPRYETQLPKQTATSDGQRRSVLSLYNRRKDILVDTARYSGLAWECGRLKKLPRPPTWHPNVRVSLLTFNTQLCHCKFQHNNCMEFSSPDDGDMSKAMRLPTMAGPSPALCLLTPSPSPLPADLSSNCELRIRYPWM
ncbi:hypothetical protein EV421DRAFT_2024461 [Armillaria borealis]|uniref:Uncharacterized protein n=1 Tax=Armillaria borealis TaxID=47425 RepID=A0AA39MES3_9AGAR|nr:hypothetical protein EV421DRAFT_2024461 [Armillaria borealis]